MEAHELAPDEVAEPREGAKPGSAKHPKDIGEPLLIGVIYRW